MFIVINTEVDQINLQAVVIDVQLMAISTGSLVCFVSTVIKKTLSPFTITGLVP